MLVDCIGDEVESLFRCFVPRLEVIEGPTSTEAQQTVIQLERGIVGGEGGRKERMSRYLGIGFLRLKSASLGTLVTLVIWRAFHTDHITRVS